MAEVSWPPLPAWERHAVLGRAAHDRAGTRLGRVTDIYVGVRTGVPLWAVLDLGGDTRLVPASSLTVLEDSLTVAFDRATVADAPAIGVGAPLSAATERALYQHYALAWMALARPGVPTAGDTTTPLVEEGGPGRLDRVLEGAVSLKALEARQLRAATVRLKRSITHVSAADAPEPAGDTADTTTGGAATVIDARPADGREVRALPPVARAIESAPVLRVSPPDRQVGDTGDGQALARDLFTDQGAANGEAGSRETGSAGAGRRRRWRRSRLVALIALVVGIVIVAATLVGAWLTTRPDVSREVTTVETPAAPPPRPSGVRGP